MLLTDPGNSIRDYIKGKRVRHYNYIAFVILIVAINHLLLSPFYERIIRITEFAGQDETTRMSFEFIEEHQKAIILALVPLNSLFSFLLFRRSGYNYAENMVLNTYMAGGNLMVSTIATALSLIITSFIADPKLNLFILMIFAPAGVIYSTIFYWQMFRPYYKNGFSLYIRSVQAYSLPLLSLLTIALGILAMFGKVHIG